MFADVVTFNNKTINSIQPRYRINAATVESSNKISSRSKSTILLKSSHLPKIHVVASIPVQGFTNYKPQNDINVDFYTMPNIYWPSDNPEILSILREILKGADTDVQKLEAIQQWVYSTIQYDGILAQGMGHYKFCNRNMVDVGINVTC